MGCLFGCLGRISWVHSQEENLLLFYPDTAHCVGAIVVMVSLKRLLAVVVVVVVVVVAVVVVCFQILFHTVFISRSHNHIFRARWTSVFSLSATKYFCLGNRSTVGLLWLQLATPIMYFAFWFMLFIIHYLKSAAKRRNASAVTNSDGYALSLMNHLVEHDMDTETDSKNVDNADSNVSSTKSASFGRLCKRFRFLRALEFLLLFSFETLTEQALQIVNCISVGSCGRVLAGYPDVSCPSEGNYVPLLVIAILILIYATACPIVLFVFLRRIHSHANTSNSKGREECHQTRQCDSSSTAVVNIHAESDDSTGDSESKHELQLKQAKFGVFFDHYKPGFWWWEVQVRCVCMCVCVCVCVFVCLFVIACVFSFFFFLFLFFFVFLFEGGGSSFLSELL